MIASNVFPMRFVDGFVNLVARLGTGRDKAKAGDYTFEPLDPVALEVAYRSSAMAKRIVDKPAEDCAREWREWQGTTDQITALDGVERALNIPEKIIAAKRGARLFGGAAIYIGADNADPALPINLNAIGKGGLRYLTVLSRKDLQIGDIQDDPRETNFGKPKFYRLSVGSARDVKIHPSRLVLFFGEQAPEGLFSFENMGWGDSVLQSTLDDVRNLDATKANIASLVYEAKVDVIKVPDLIQNLAQKGEAYEKLILQRLSLGATAKGNNGTLLLDSSEEYDQKTFQFSTLPDILDRFMQAVSAAAEIPMTILFGMSPAGLNATGDADIRNYYDRIRTMQQFELTPAMAVLDEVIIRSALGSRPPELHYTWRPLWQPTAKEKAEVAKMQAETLEKLKTINVLSEEATQVVGVNAMVETGAFPGIEDAADEFPVDFEETDEGGESDLNPGNEPLPNQEGTENAVR